jgi:hypothetical protein
MINFRPRFAGAFHSKDQQLAEGGRVGESSGLDLRVFRDPAGEFARRSAAEHGVVAVLVEAGSERLGHAS